MEKNRYNDSTNKGYIEYLDYCRALGAFVIVMLHSGIDAIQHFFIFALPMFFVISGFVYKPDKQTKRDYIKGRFKRLVIPFWGFTAMYMIVEAVRSAVLGYGTLHNLITFPVYMIYGSSILPPVTGISEIIARYSYPYALAFGRVYIASPSANHLWFLPALFTGSIMFCILEEKTRKSILSKMIAIGFLLAIAYFDSSNALFKQLPWGIGTGAFGAACMLCGYWVRENRFLEKSGKSLIPSVVIGLIMAVLAEYLGSTGGAMISSYYGPRGLLSVCLTFAGGLGGAWFVICLMKGLYDSKAQKLKSVLSLVGKASMQIYEYQMLLLFVFGYLFLLISGTTPQLDVWLLGFVPLTPATIVFLVVESLAIVVLINWWERRRSGSR